VTAALQAAADAAPLPAAPAPEGNFVTDLLWSLSSWVPEGLRWPLVVLLGALLGAGFFLLLVFVTPYAMFAIWLERKISARMQQRRGPNRVGPFGLLQSIADALKLLLKEDLIPTGADKVLFVLAPALVMASAVAMFAAVPFAPALYFTDLDLGIFYIVAISALTTIGVIMAGWSSNNKWSLYGAMREAAAVVSYEVPLSLALLVPVIVSGTLSLHEAAEAQEGWGGAAWFLWRNPFMLPTFFVYFTAALAETRRAPFDLPEAESELVAGFHTEYSGMRFSFFFLEEYAAMFVVSAIGTAFFLGGWSLPGLTPLVESAFGKGAVFQAVAVGVFVAKALFLVFVMMWLRWTLPRIRIDQVMTTGYKYLTPLALACVLGAGAWELYVRRLFGGA
jgi:NADH-quinone oxidoreductase subunit H